MQVPYDLFAALSDKESKEVSKKYLNPFERGENLYNSSELYRSNPGNFPSQLKDSMIIWRERLDAATVTRERSRESNNS
jgi:hypothetical protein